MPKIVSIYIHIYDIYMYIYMSVDLNRLASMYILIPYTYIFCAALEPVNAARCLCYEWFCFLLDLNTFKRGLCH